MVVEVRRDHIIRDALFQLQNKSSSDLKKQLRVSFVGEEGIDEGGIQKGILLLLNSLNKYALEFFSYIVKEMFQEQFGLFTYNPDSRLSWFANDPNRDASSVEEFMLLGMNHPSFFIN